MSMQEAPTPPGILDLILWEPSPVDHHHTEAFDLQPRLWSQLPDHLLHSVLARLPFQSVLRFRSVCRQWKALFSSPSFVHLPSQAPHIPPWLFFLGSRHRRRFRRQESDADIHYDDGRDDNGFVYEGATHGSRDHDSESTSSMWASVDPQDAYDAMRHGEHDSIYDAMLWDDNESMNDASRCGNHGEMHGVDDKDDDHADEPYVLEEQLLIFDFASGSWRPALACPTGFDMRSPNCFSRFDVCSLHEHLLLYTCSEPSRFFIFNPAASLCKELPPCHAAHVLEGLGLREETTSPARPNTSMNANDLRSLSKENGNTEEFVQDMTAKTLQVVVVGETIGQGQYAVENFNSSTGVWRICGYLSQADDTYFMQKRMLFHKGSFYTTTTKGILKMDILQDGQKMECTFREMPITPSDIDPRNMLLTESRLVATKESIYMVGVTLTYALNSHLIEEWDILIWQYFPQAADSVCWQFIAYTPKDILDNYFGESEECLIDCRAHGDFIFLQIPNRHRFLMYDLRKKQWSFSAKCKWFLGSMIFVWEPLLRN